VEPLRRTWHRGKQQNRKYSAEHISYHHAFEHLFSPTICKAGLKGAGHSPADRFPETAEPHFHRSLK